MLQRGHRRSLTVIVWFVVSAASALGLLALQPIIGLSPAVLSLVMLAPAIGAGVCWLLPRRGWPTFPKAAALRRFGVAIAISMVVVAVYFVIISVVRGAAPELPSTGTPVLIIIGAQLVGALAEEIGFRGLLLPTLESWLPRPAAAVLVGLLFGLWHVQYFALPLPQHLAFVVGTIALTLTMAYVMVGSFWQRMLVCTIIHAGANLALSFTGADDVSMIGFCLAIMVGCAIALLASTLVGVVTRDPARTEGIERSR